MIDATTPSRLASPTAPGPTLPDAYLSLRDAAQELAEASDQFLAARNRWQQAQARWAECSQYVEKAREQAGA